MPLGASKGIAVSNIKLNKALYCCRKVFELDPLFLFFVRYKITLLNHNKMIQNVKNISHHPRKVINIINKILFSIFVKY